MIGNDQRVESLDEAILMTKMRYIYVHSRLAVGVVRGEHDGMDSRER